MALVVNNGPRFDAAAVFTRNRVVASPVKISRKAVADGQLRAVVFNSGNANACNGARGDEDAEALVAEVSHALSIPQDDIAACSTGLIGEPLPMDRALSGARAVANDLGTDVECASAAAAAILTTDTVSKEASYSGSGWSVGAMGKGVGMMAPSLATMLVCLTTDAVVEAPALQHALDAAAAKTSVSYTHLTLPTIYSV